MRANLIPITIVDYHILIGYPNISRYIRRMRRVLGFLVPLALGLALLTFLGHWTLVGTMRACFESDLSQRSRLAVASARRSLTHDWHKDEPRFAATLLDITCDEHIMAADAIVTALKMPKDEQRERMRATRRFVSEFNVCRWAGRMLVDAAELRRKDRLFGRFTNWTRYARVSGT